MLSQKLNKQKEIEGKVEMRVEGIIIKLLELYLQIAMNMLRTN